MKTKTPIGEFDKRITIQALTRTADGVGGHTEAWSTYAATWAKIETLSGNEDFQAWQIQSTNNYRILIRYRTGVKPEMRVNYGDRYFRILAVQNVDFADWELELTCEEVQPGVS